MEGIQALHLLSICLTQINLSSGGQVIGMDYLAWMEAANSFGYDKEMMSILFQPIEASVIDASNKNTRDE